MTTQQSFLNKARKDKFLLVISPPKALAPIATDLGINDLQISLFTSPIPTIAIPPEEVSFKGQQYKVTSQTRTAYPPLAINFTIDNDFKNYWFLWKWLDIQNKVEDSGMDPYFNQYRETAGSAVIANRGNKDVVSKVPFSEITNKSGGMSVYPDYQVNLSVFGLDEYNNKKIEFTFTDAFITELGAIEYNYREDGECECSASFAYGQLHSRLVGVCSENH